MFQTLNKMHDIEVASLLPSPHLYKQLKTHEEKKEDSYIIIFFPPGIKTGTV